MATKKHKPYDPFHPFGNHSLAWFQQQAQQRAANDANAQIAALPSSSFYADSAKQLSDALAGLQAKQAGVAGAGGQLYSDAFNAASSPAARAAMVGGGTGVAGPANTSLVGALGASMAQAFGGGQAAALARGRNDVLDLAKQQAAIRAGIPKASADYLTKMQDQAMQAAAGFQNAQLAQQQFGLQAANTAFDNQLASDRLNFDIANAGAKNGAKSSAKLNKTMAAARKAARDAAKGTKTTNTVGGDYTFNVPNSILTGDLTVTGTTPHVVRAKDGNDALAQITNWVRSNPNYDTTAQLAPQSWSAGPFKPVTKDVLTTGSRTAQLHAAIAVFTDAGYDRATAIRYARQIIGSKAGKRKKKPPVDHVGGPH